MSNLKFLVLSFSYALCALHFTLIRSSLCYAQPLSSQELIEKALDYDSQLVTYQGEVVGELMRRGDFAWANVQDGKNALGIWLDKGLAVKIGFCGSYKFQGDRIKVTGVFHRACNQHGGDLDIHALEIEQVSGGYPIYHPINIHKEKLAIILLWISVCLEILVIFKKRRLRRFPGRAI